MKCDFCGKQRLVGNKVSHSNMKTKTQRKPNIQKVRAVVGNKSQRVHVCTRCMRSGVLSKTA